MSYIVAKWRRGRKFVWRERITSSDIGGERIIHRISLVIGV